MEVILLKDLNKHIFDYNLYLHADKESEDGVNDLFLAQFKLKGSQKPELFMVKIISPPRYNC